MRSQVGMHWFKNYTKSLFVSQGKSKMLQEHDFKWGTNHFHTWYRNGLQFLHSKKLFRLTLIRSRKEIHKKTQRKTF